MLHLVHLEVVPPTRRVGRLVHYEPVEACGILHLDGVGIGLGVVRLHVRPPGFLYGLLGSVGQSDQPWKEPVQLLYGGALLGLPVDVLRNGEELPYGRGNLADVGRDGPLAEPEQVGNAVLYEVGAIVHEGRRTIPPQVQCERAARLSSLFRSASGYAFSTSLIKKPNYWGTCRR